MSRVIAVVACGLMLSACSSSWMPSFELPSMPSFGGGSSSAPAAGALAIESDPPGAEARASTGATCRTPCRLNVAATGPFTVSIALNGYVPQSVPVQILRPDDPRLGSEDSQAVSARFEPNPVYVELERAPPPAAPAKKKPTPKRPATAARHAPPATANQAPAPSAPTTAVGPSAPPPAPAQQPGSGAAPWPMPR